jgi:hypothetical protein
MKTLVLSLCALLLGLAQPASAQVRPAQCGSLKNAYGPFDYRGQSNPLSPTDSMPIVQKRALVEDWHFTTRVENLTGGQSAQGGIGIGIDIDYTLRAFPNNYRALLAAMKYGEKLKSPRPPGLQYEVECYFERALRFQANDNLVRMIYAKFLANNKRTQDALSQLSTVLESTDDNAFTHQNVGLIYFDLGEYDLALEQAHIAIELGLEKPTLKQRLQEVGKWKDALDVTENPTAASAPGKS